jgi:hypothetical protein
MGGESQECEYCTCDNQRLLNKRARSRRRAIGKNRLKSIENRQFCAMMPLQPRSRGIRLAKCCRLALAEVWRPYARLAPARV